MEARKFVEIGEKCYRMECDGFDISYVPKLEMHELNPHDLDLIAKGQIKAEHIGLPETAIIIRDPTQFTGYSFFILYGDYREQYAKLSENGLDACVEFFVANIEHITDTSDMPKERIIIQ